MAYQAELLERENNQLQDKLADSVSQLRHISIGFRDDVNRENRYLDSMAGDFGSAQGLLSGTVKRVNWMIRSGGSNSKLMFYTIVAILAIFFMLYYLVHS